MNVFWTVIGNEQGGTSWSADGAHCLCTQDIASKPQIVVKETTACVDSLPFTEKGRGKVVIVENSKCQLVLYVKDVSYIKKEKNFYCVPWKEKGKLLSGPK